MQDDDSIWLAQTQSLPAFVRKKITPAAPDECWLWRGALGVHGYGQIHLLIDGKDRHRMPHRVVYEHLVGPIPAGLQIDHLCRVRHCVNPAHLEPVTNAENTRRGRLSELNTLRAKRRKHCKRGHLYDEFAEGERRHCRVCHRMTSSCYRLRKIAEKRLAALRLAGESENG